jgi:hypothetical protein
MNKEKKHKKDASRHMSLEKYKLKLQGASISKNPEH